MFKGGYIDFRQAGAQQTLDIPQSAVACCSWSWPWLRLKMTPFWRADVGAAAYTIPWDVWYIIPGYGGAIILAAYTHTHIHTYVHYS